MATQAELAKKAFDALNARDQQVKRLYRGYRQVVQPKCIVCGAPAQLFGVGGPWCTSDKCAEEKS